MKTIENVNEIVELITDYKTLVLDFYADWCNPCQIMLPILEELSYDENIKTEIVKVNVDKLPELATLFKIYSIPTLILFKNGTIVETLIGIHSKTELEQKLLNLELLDV